MNVSEIFPPAVSRSAFELYSLNRITDCSGCYCLTNAVGEILYIGQARSIASRLLQHFDSSKRTVATPQGRVSIAWWREEQLEKLNALERGWIESVRLRDGVMPPLNRVGAPT